MIKGFAESYASLRRSDSMIIAASKAPVRCINGIRICSILIIFSWAIVISINISMNAKLQERDEVYFNPLKRKFGVEIKTAIKRITARLNDLSLFCIFIFPLNA